jgi:hypothetical protein
MSGFEIAEVVLAGVSVVQSAVQSAEGGLSFTSDQLTYPDKLERVGDAQTMETQAAHLWSVGYFVNNNTVIKLYGEFSNSNEPATPSNRVMANVRLGVDATTTYSQSALSFSANALNTPYGTAEDPRIRFECTGRFDPAGVGDCGFRVIIEIDTHAYVQLIDADFTHGTGDFMDLTPSGFGLSVGPVTSDDGSQPRG